MTVKWSAAEDIVSRQVGAESDSACSPESSGQSSAYRALAKYRHGDERNDAPESPAVAGHPVRNAS